jgi:succinoglycan biosynthesis protein ExoL
VKVLFLVPVLANAYYQGRVRALARVGVQPTVLGFERAYYPGKPEAGYVSLGRVKNREYTRRLMMLGRAMARVRRAAEGADVIYAFGLDMLLLGWLASRGLGKRIKLAYDVADIQQAQLDEGRVSSALRRLERFLLERTKLLVVTSRAYVDHYYQGILGMNGVAYHVIENKLEAGAFGGVPGGATGRSGNVLRIGYFGMHRCARSWEILQEVSKRAGGSVQVYIRGFPVTPKDLAEQARHLDHVEYGGPYVAPDELPDLYGQVDLVWACYLYQEGQGLGNWRWARTHRFYEACYFNKPMFCQAGTEDGRVAERLGLGLCLDLGDVEGTVARILAITPEEIARWTRNIEALPSEVYSYSDEHARLYEALAS